MRLTPSLSILHRDFHGSVCDGRLLPDIHGFSGDNGPATAAKLNFPVGVALDAAGNLFIADAFNDRNSCRSGTDSVRRLTQTLSRDVLNMKRLGITVATFAANMEVAVAGPRAFAEGIYALNPELVVLPDGTEIRAAPGQGGERGVTRPN